MCVYVGVGVHVPYKLVCVHLYMALHGSLCSHYRCLVYVLYLLQRSHPYSTPPYIAGQHPYSAVGLPGQ